MRDWRTERGTRSTTVVPLPSAELMSKTPASTFAASPQGQALMEIQQAREAPGQTPGLTPGVTPDEYREQLKRILKEAYDFEV